MADVQKTVDELIRDHSVMIFSKRECSHCEKTKKLFLKKHIQTYVMELDEKDNGDALQYAVKNSTYNKDHLGTVPQIFVSTTSLGGNSHVQELEHTGELDSKLKTAGVEEGSLVFL